MKDINKILLFLTFALIYSSVIYLVGQKTEVELDISNSLLYDLLAPRYTDGTYAYDYHWTTYTNGSTPKFKLDPICDNNLKQLFCTYHILWSNESLKGMTHIKVNIPFNLRFSYEISQFITQTQGYSLRLGNPQYFEDK